jgi:phenylacetate-CoA ligase
VRGQFVHPHQVATILARHELAKGRAVVDRRNGQDRLRLLVEAGGGAGLAGLAEALSATVREVTTLRGEVEFVEPGTLADDGKVIDDRRG